MVESVALIHPHLSPLLIAPMKDEAKVLHGMLHDLVTFALHVTSYCA